MILNNIDDNFIYSGNVTLSVKDIKRNKIIQTKHIKNAGTEYLFKFLCNCLAGTFDGTKKPRYLDASDSQYSNNLSSNLYYRSILTNIKVIPSSESITLQDGSTINIPQYHVRYSATILQNQVNSAKKTIKCLVLCNSPDYSDVTSSILAYIDIADENGENGIEIGDNQALIIEWDLSFNNYIKNQLKEA